MALLNDIISGINTSKAEQEDIWDAYIASFKEKKRLATELLKTGDVAVAKKIGALIPNELVEIGEEERRESRIIMGLRRLSTVKLRPENKYRSSVNGVKEENRVYNLKNDILAEEAMAENILLLLQKLSEILGLEREAVRTLNQNPKRQSEIIYYLQNLIVVREDSITSLWIHGFAIDAHKGAKEEADRIIRGG